VNPTAVALRCSDCGMAYEGEDPERFLAMHEQFKAPQHSICDRGARIRRCSEEVAYWSGELDAAESAVGGL
jgi:hypothetical protein